MNDKEKINTIGILVNDIKFEVLQMKQHIDQVRTWMLYPEKLKVARQVEKIMRPTVKRRK